MNAQLYDVKGKVTNTSIEPIPFVIVNVQDQINKSFTNEKGEFIIKLANGHYTIFFTLIGYKPFKQDIIVNNNHVNLKIILEEDQQLLNEIEVSSKYTDPARALIKNVIRNKDKYVQQSYTSNLYIKAIETENINAKDSLEIILNKDTAQKSNKSDKSIFDKMNFAEVVIKKSFEYPNKLKEERIAYSSRGAIESLFYLRSTEGEFNFYNNAVYCPTLSEMPFQSPLSTSGLLVYKYKTLKVYTENGKRIFKIRVEPNIIGNSLISGEMEIIDTLFCIRNLKFTFPKYQLAEYSFFELEASFSSDDTASFYHPKKFIFNYKTGGKKSGSKGKTVVYFNDFKLTNHFSKKYFNTEVSSTLKDAYEKDSTFWNQVRKEPLTEKELKFIRETDSIITSHKTKVYLDSIDRDENRITLKKIVLFGQTHYNREKDLRFSFNPLWTTYRPVGIGGARIGYGSGFDKEFKNKKTLDGNVNMSYGILNKDLTGELTFSNMYNPFSRSRWSTTIGKNYDVINTNNSWLSVFRTSNFFLTEHIDLSHNTELVNGLFWRIQVEYATQKSISNIKNDTLTSLLFDNYKYQNVAFDLYDAFYVKNIISYTPYQKYIREPSEKIILGSKFPTFYITHKKGIPGIFKSSINFDYLEFSIEQDIDFRFLGIAKYRIYSGKFHNLNNVRAVDFKYQALVGFPFFANPINSFQALEKSYITLNRFYSGHYLHRFNGAFINKIPFLKFLNMSESGGAGFLISEENNLTYFEFFAGIEKNIRIFNEQFRLGVFWVNSKSNNYPFRSGFRFSIDMYDKVNNKWSY